MKKPKGVEKSEAATTAKAVIAAVVATAASAKKLDAPAAAAVVRGNYRKHVNKFSPNTQETKR